MSWKTRTVISALALSLVALPSGATSSRENTNHPTPSKGEPDLAPTGKGWGEHHAQGIDNRAGKGGAKPVKSNGINYHGGPVMLNTVTMYYIWYGSWTNASPAIAILENLAQHIGGSGYYNINTTYYNGSNQHVSNSIAFGGSMLTPAYLGNSLSDSQIQKVVSDAIAANQFPKNANAVYFVLTSSDVNASSGFCSQYCGWHTHGTISGSDIKYAFIGDPTRCPSSCEAQATGPNGSSGGDGMASIISHELEEATSDPDLNAWYDTRGYENADKCAWTFGTESTASNGAKYNVTLGSTKYLIQRNWVNASGGYCSMSY
jgi:hypothetical protein